MKYDLNQSVVEHLPHLRAFALLLARERALADDLVQEAVVRALSHAHQFQPGTNFKAWISTILRNSYFNEIRHRNRVSQISASDEIDDQTVSGGQEEHLEIRDFNRAFHTLTSVQREALVLVGASGFSYEEAAEIAGCAVGTMKSRVSRARTQLHDMLNGNRTQLEGAIGSPKTSNPTRDSQMTLAMPDEFRWRKDDDTLRRLAS